MNKALLKRASCLMTAIMFAVAGTLFVSCGGDSGGGDPTPITIKNVRITGTAKVGQTLTASATDTSGASGENVSGVTYQWYYSSDDENFVSDNAVAISNATDRTWGVVREITVNEESVDLLGKYIWVSASKNGSTEYGVARTSVADTTIEQVDIVGTTKVGFTLTAKVTDSDGDDATDNANVTYQWYKISSETEVELDATTKSYTVTAADYNTTIKVVASLNGASRFATVGPIGKGTLVDSYTLAYGTDGSVESITETIGNDNNATDKATLKSLTVSGLKDATSGADVANGTAAFGETALTASKAVTITIRAEGYDPLTKDVFVTVKAAAPAENVLSLVTDATALAAISAGFTKFSITDAASYAALEFSADGGTIWQAITTEQFAAQSTTSDDTTTYTALKVRTKAVGTQGQAGYVAESDSVEIEVSENNIGTKPAAHVEVKLGEDISIPADSSDDKKFTVPAGYTSYKWFVDGEEETNATSNEYTFETTNRKAGTYIITVQATKNSLTYSSHVTVTVN